MFWETRVLFDLFTSSCFGMVSKVLFRSTKVSIIWVSLSSEVWMICRRDVTSWAVDRWCLNPNWVVSMRWFVDVMTRAHIIVAKISRWCPARIFSSKCLGMPSRLYGCRIPITSGRIHCFGGSSVLYENWFISSKRIFLVCFLDTLFFPLWRCF